MIEILVSATVLMIVILCLRLLTKGRVSMRLRYALWLLVALRLAVPVSFGSSQFSLMNLAGRLEEGTSGKTVFGAGLPDKKPVSGRRRKKQAAVRDPMIYRWAGQNLQLTAKPLSDSLLLQGMPQRRSVRFLTGHMVRRKRYGSAPYLYACGRSVCWQSGVICWSVRYVSCVGCMTGG